MTTNRELLSILADMVKATRCCQHDTAFCGGVTFSQFNILDLIAKHEMLGLSDLHELLSVEKSTSTRLIEPLVQQGLVKKERSARDSRAINLTLTEKGRETNSELWTCLDIFFERLSKEIPQDKREEIYEHVILFINAIKKVITDSGCC